jgi:hypothetical protein
MSLSVDLGLRLGRSLIGVVPPTDVNTPSVALTSSCSISMSTPEALAPEDIATMLNGGGLTAKIVSFSDFVTLTGGAVTAMTDFSGGSRTWSQGGAAGTRPAYTAQDGTVGGHASFITDGVGTWLPNTNYNPPAPGTTPIWMRLLAKHITRVASGQMICGSATNRLGIRDNGSPNVFQGNGVNGADVAMALGTWFAVDAYFAAKGGPDAGTLDYLWIGGTKSSAALTGGVGNTDVTAISLGARTDGVVPGNYGFAGAIIVEGGDVTGTKRTNLDAWLAKWGNGALTLPT